MILGADKIKGLIEKGVNVFDSEGKEKIKPLIENIGIDQIDKIEGTTVDLRLDEAFELLGGASLGLKSRVTPKIKTILDKSSDNQILTIKPNEFFLVQTMETVNIPPTILADVRNRTTLFRCGLYLKTAYISPNYQGVLTFGLKNLSGFPVEIERGFRIACISFSTIDGESVPYQGVWQGKRASTNGEEERPF